MGVYSQVEGVPQPYDAQVKLWDEARRYRHGDAVPDVGMADTYAVRLGAPGGTHARYLWVQEGRITNVLAHQPVPDKSVFDKWGKYLGRGGERLEGPGPNPVTGAVGLLDDILGRTDRVLSEHVESLDRVDEILDDVEKRYGDPRRAPGGKDTVARASDAGPPMLTHRFHLRTDVEIELGLPWDISDGEAERLSEFVRTLPLRTSPRDT